jgi:hypothetical protein
VKVSQERSSIVLAAEKMFSFNHSHTYDYEQILLNEFIWPIAGNNSLILYIIQSHRKNLTLIPLPSGGGLDFSQ